MNATEQELELAKDLFKRELPAATWESYGNQYRYFAVARAAIEFLKPAPVAVLTQAQILDYLKAANEQMRKESTMGKHWKDYSDKDWKWVMSWMKAGFRAIGLLPPEPVETPGKRFMDAVDAANKIARENLSKESSIGKMYDTATAKARKLIADEESGIPVTDAERRAALDDLEIKK